MNPELAYVALGSNMGDSVKTISSAIRELRRFSSKPVLKSSLWRSAPVGCPPGSPDFVNAVIVVAPFPGETPMSLLAKLRRIEKKFGRRRKKILNEPRPLDLDLIAFGARTAHSKRLTLPHPRAHVRQFVLRPLSEVEPGLTLPGQTKSVRELLRCLRTEEKLRKLRR